MEMVDDAVSAPRTYGEALGHELLMQFFPWSWVVSGIDLLMLPITLPYDMIELAISRDQPYAFEQQVQDRRRQGVHWRTATPPTPENVSKAGPKMRNERRAEHLEP